MGKTLMNIVQITLNIPPKFQIKHSIFKKILVTLLIQIPDLILEIMKKIDMRSTIVAVPKIKLKKTLNH